MNDWSKAMELGRAAEAKMDLSAAETYYGAANDSARTVGEENISWGALSRVARLADSQRGFS